MARLGRNMVQSLFGQVLTLLLSLVGTNLINVRLGPDFLGLYHLSLAIAAVASAIVDLGFASTVVRETARFRESDPRYVQTLVGTATAAYLAMIAVVGTSLVALCPVIVRRWITVQQLPAPRAALVLAIMIAAALLPVLRLLYVSILQGCQRAGYSSIVAAISAGIQQLGVLAVLAFSSSPVVLSLWYLAVSLGSLGVLAYASGREIGFGSLTPRWNGEVARRNAEFVRGTLATGLFAALTTRTDRFIIASLLPVKELGYYGVASSLITKVMGLVNSIELAGYPAMADAYQRKVDFLPTFQRVDDTLAILSAPAFAAVVFAAQPVLAVVLDPGTAALLVLPVSLLGLGSYMNALISAPYRATLAAGLPRLIARPNLIGLLVVVPVTYLSVQRWGLVGAPIGYLTYHLLFFLVAMPAICAEALGIPARRWYGRAAAFLLTVSISYSSILWLGSPGPLLNRVIAYLAGTLVFLSVALGLIATPPFREAVRRRLRLT